VPLVQHLVQIYHEVVPTVDVIHPQVQTTEDIDREAEVGFGILLELLLLQVLLQLVFSNIRDARRRRRQNVSVNEDVRIPNTRDLVPALDLYHQSEPRYQSDYRIWFLDDAVSTFLFQSQPACLTMSYVF